jgi:hypothetical protein
MWLALLAHTQLLQAVLSLTQVRLSIVWLADALERVGELENSKRGQTLSGEGGRETGNFLAFCGAFHVCPLINLKGVLYPISTSCF